MNSEDQLVVASIIRIRFLAVAGPLLSRSGTSIIRALLEAATGKRIRETTPASADSLAGSW